MNVVYGVKCKSQYVYSIMRCKAIEILKTRIDSQSKNRINKGIEGGVGYGRRFMNVLGFYCLEAWRCVQTIGESELERYISFLTNNVYEKNQKKQIIDN